MACARCAPVPPKEPPASTAVQISALVLPDAVIEIEAVAVIAS